jgi:hypothetical protein
VSAATGHVKQFIRRIGDSNAGAVLQHVTCFSRSIETVPVHVYFSRGSLIGDAQLSIHAPGQKKRTSATIPDRGNGELRFFAPGQFHD